MCFPQRESGFSFGSAAVGFGQRRRRRRIRVEKSSETLAGQAFLDVALKATEDAEDSMSRE